MHINFNEAIDQICDEKNISRDIVLETVEAALSSAYKKDYGSRDQDVRVDIDNKTGEVKAYIKKEVVDVVEDDNIQITLEDAKKVKKSAKIGDEVEISDMPEDFGRIAAQTAKQVIIQRIREAERDMVFEEFKDKEGEIVSGIVQRVEGDTVIVDLGKASGILYRSEQINTERYFTSQRLKVYIVKVESMARGPQIVLSRAHPDMVRKLFEMEVPEILAGTIEIKSVSREAGGRSKVAVHSNEEGVDPVGALVGQRGSRVQSVMSELGEEKIDVILWDPDINVYVTNALSPAKVVGLKVDKKETKISVTVPEDQLSLAIGKKGQNVRLAAKLTGWNVDIMGADESGVEKVATVAKKPKKASDIEDEIMKSISSQDENDDAGESKKKESKEKIKKAEDILKKETIASGEKAEEPKKEIKKEEPIVKEPKKMEEPVAEEKAEEASKKEVKKPKDDTEKSASVDDILKEEGKI